MGREGKSRVAWRQSLGAGLLLGLALGCAWLAHWTPRLYPRILLTAIAALLALLGLGLLLSLSEGAGWSGAWQERIESRFPAAGLPFFSLVAVLGLAALVSGNNLLYLVLAGMLAALLVSSIVSTLNLSGMELHFRLPEEIVAGRPAAVGFTLHNAKRYWPAYALTVSAASRGLQPREELAAAMRPAYFGYLAGGENANAQSEIVYPRRGRYQAAGFMLGTRFPFGLLQKRRRFQASRREPASVVYPAPAPPGKMELEREAAGPLARDRRGDGQDLYRIRPLLPGDSARQMHWKASARVGSPRVREFGDESALQVRLRLAIPPGTAETEAEAAISACAGWMEALIERGAWVEFVGENAMPGEDRQPARGLFLPLAPAARQRRAVLEYLALVDVALPRAAAAGPAGSHFEITVGPAAAPAEAVSNK